MYSKLALPRTSSAVRRRLGSGSSIFLTRSLALSETLCHGARLKSTTDRIIAWATPCSVSAYTVLYVKSFCTRKIEDMRYVSHDLTLEK